MTPRGNSWMRLVFTDEMNCYAPQGIGAIEALTTGSSRYHIVDAQRSGPVMGCVQNSLAMTGICTNIFPSPRLEGDKPTTKFPSGEPGYEILIPSTAAYDAYAQADISNEEIKDYIHRLGQVYPQYVKKNSFTKYITGKVLYSIVFPRNLRWKRATSTNEKLPNVEIWDGILTQSSAPLDKSCIGGTSGSIVHIMWKRHPKEASKFINRISMISGVLNFRVGFSFSFGDCQTTPQAAKDIKVTTAEAKASVKNTLGKGLEKEEEEKEVNNIYNKVRDIAPTLAKSKMRKGAHSSLSILTLFGIKGNPLNVSQTAGIIGQQNVGGNRIPWGCTFQTRMTPHFQRNESNPEAKGFILNSFLEGPDFKGTFAASIAGREGVVASATKTADSGYAQKKLSKVLGNVKARYDGTLRNAQGKIISFLYGGDGLNPKMMIQSHFPENERIKGPKELFFVRLDELLGSLESDFEREHEVPYPRKKILTETHLNFIVRKLQAGVPGYQSPSVVTATKNLKETTKKLLDGVETYSEIVPAFAKALVDEYERAKVHDGYSAGFVACLSIGEILTQLTLNIFHVSGIGEKSLTGLPRLNELINMTPQPKKPTMTIYPLDPVLKKIQEQPITEESKIQGLKRIREISAHLTHQTVGGILLEPPKVLRIGPYDPERESPLSFEGLYESYERPDWVDFYCDITGKEIHEKEWVIMLSLDPRKMYESSLTPNMVAEAIEKNYAYIEGGLEGSSVFCFPSPSSNPQVLVTLNPEDAGNYAKQMMSYPEGINTEKCLYTENNIAFFAAREVSKLLTQIQVQGIYGITKISQRFEGQEWVIDAHGSNFQEVLADPLVDQTRTVSDSVWEVYQVLGIEAAKTFFEQELKKVICFDGANVSDRHFRTVAEVICFSGTPTQISRYGITRDVGPLTKIMFEKPVAEAVASVVYGDIDDVQSIDASIYMGLAPKVGTGSVKVISGEISRSERK
jgi:DNA-directed RNA polymerase beta' subunit